MIFTLFSVLVIRNFSKTRKTVQRGISYRGIETGCTAMGQCNMNYTIVPLERDAHGTCFNGIFSVWLLYIATRL